jgi:carbon-monoxide dehydrogenase small subunit
MMLDLDVNGRPLSVDVEPCVTLAELLRDHLGLTGTKVSCDVQVCGACTVLLDGAPYSACTTLAYEARGRELTTIEGLGGLGETLHSVQQAFLAESAFQCGFCTPGMILSAVALLEEEPAADEDRVVEFMDGNLCRCTGYTSILKAIRRAQAERAARGGA